MRPYRLGRGQRRRAIRYLAGALLHSVGGRWKSAPLFAEELASGLPCRLELEDLGFHFSVLCEFRARLIRGGGEALVFEKLLAHAKGQGWLKARGRQRTDSTHVLAAVETLSRLECVAETFRHALNGLSATIPEWVQAHVPVEWYERYAMRWQDYRLPSGRQERQDLTEMIGQDGRRLLALLSSPGCATCQPWTGS